jgi:hypothetical protein
VLEGENRRNNERRRKIEFKSVSTEDKTTGKVKVKERIWCRPKLGEKKGQEKNGGEIL